MKKCALLLSAAAFLFCGCFDVVHYIEPRGKNVFIDYRITSVMGKNDRDFKFDKDEILKDLNVKGMKTPPTIKDCGSEFENGFDLSLTVPDSMLKLPDEKTKFPIIPYRDRLGQYVLVFRSDKKLSKDDKMAQALLMTAKYRIALGGGFKLQRASLVTNDSPPKTSVLSHYSLGSLSFVDIPLGLVLGNEAAVVLAGSPAISTSEMVSFFSALNKKRDDDEAKARADQERLDKIEQEKQENDERLRIEKEKEEMNSIEKVPGQDMAPE